MYLYCLDCDVKGNNYVNKCPKLGHQSKSLWRLFTTMQTKVYGKMKELKKTVSFVDLDSVDRLEWWKEESDCLARYKNTQIYKFKVQNTQNTSVPKVKLKSPFCQRFVCPSNTSSTGLWRTSFTYKRSFLHSGLSQNSSDIPTITTLHDLMASVRASMSEDSGLSV